ncbi:MAG: hypothetical protein ACM3JI_03945, partial [Anaerolineae bacterium]
MEGILRYSRLLSNFLLLLLIPCLIIYPQAEVTAHTVQAKELATSMDIVQGQENATFSYDEIIRFVEELEEGELEKRCTPQELERINHFIVFLAKEGILPDDSNEASVLEDDIEELLHTENSYSALFSLDYGGAYVLPAVFYGGVEAMLCKSWFKKKWDQAKKFVKKNKKA